MVFAKKPKRSLTSSFAKQPNCKIGYVANNHIVFLDIYEINNFAIWSFGK